MKKWSQNPILLRKYNKNNILFCFFLEKKKEKIELVISLVVFILEDIDVLLARAKMSNESRTINAPLLSVEILTPWTDQRHSFVSNKHKTNSNCQTHEIPYIPLFMSPLPVTVSIFGISKLPLKPPLFLCRKIKNLQKHKRNTVGSYIWQKENSKSLQNNNEKKKNKKLFFPN